MTLTRFNEWLNQWETITIDSVTESYITDSENWHKKMKEYADEMHQYYDAD